MLIWDKNAIQKNVITSQFRLHENTQSDAHLNKLGLLLVIIKKS